MVQELFTIGHSDHKMFDFLRLLRSHGITALVDVRSHPISRVHPQFNKRVLAGDLKKAKIEEARQKAGAKAATIPFYKYLGQTIPNYELARDDGSKQWAYKGKPLYTWVKDAKPGDRTGDGFNNAWRVARP